MSKELQSFSAGTVVLYPGAVSKLYRVHKGLIRLHAVDNEGNGLTLRYVKPGGFFGEEAITGTPRLYFAEAITNSEAEPLTPSELDSGERSKLLAYCAETIRYLYQALHRLSGKQLKARIAAELLELQDSALATRDSNGNPVVHLTHDALAGAVGSVRETVTKVVGELARTGAIDAGYGKVTLTDMALLKTIADS